MTGVRQVRCAAPERYFPETNNMWSTTLGRFRSMTRHFAFIALVAVAVAAGEQTRSRPSPAASLEAARDADVTGDLAGPGAVYTLTNQVGGNAAAGFTRGADGRLAWAGSVATGGTGTGASLGSQGAVSLSNDGRRLFAVNAGSNDVSVFAVSRTGLALASRTASGGTLPISLTVHGNVLYVLNAGGSGNISGFTLGASGDLTPIAGATLPLSGSTVGPADVQFSPDGSRLVVTEKNTNLLDVYAVDANGVASGPTTTASAGGTPDGAIRLVDANGGTALIGAGINDIALSHNSRYLYVLQTGGAQAIHAFRVAADGHLTPLGPIAGLPAGTRGLAAR